ncbi:hypothetical protein [Microcoleus sp. FACHB-68]|uniref:hypothetical protein n=1 Tax=Microcoleus sp. FACHB-68 TaxID=2692826 RepID=UPI00168341C2|nr:hypothetical protein [Microcoleus sp. FACHB-68]MBD1939002.1 hypothetical protein [Microcoleus sp. FACHB-68]
MADALEITEEQRSNAGIVAFSLSDCPRAGTTLSIPHPISPSRQTYLPPSLPAYLPAALQLPIGSG